MLEVFLSDVIGILWVFDDLKCGLETTISKVDVHSLQVSYSVISLKHIREVACLNCKQEPS